jgi:hypothetical protein
LTVVIEIRHRRITSPRERKQSSIGFMHASYT